MPSQSFFDRYPDEYDLLTDEKARITKHQVEVEALIAEFSPQSVLDAGCGTGLTTSLFARHGIKSVGIDRSLPMLNVAKRKYGGKKWPLNFQKASFESLPSKFDGSFNLIICLGNSISGVESASALKNTSRAFARALSPGGSLVLQLLNIASLEDGEVYPVRATRSKNLYFLRYLIRAGKTVSLHVVRIDTSPKSPSFGTFIHAHKPLDSSILRRSLSAVGFQRISLYSDLHMMKKFSRTSRDLVLIARKPK